MTENGAVCSCADLIRSYRFRPICVKVHFIFIKECFNFSRTESYQNHIKFQIWADVMIRKDGTLTQMLLHLLIDL